MSNFIRLYKKDKSDLITCYNVQMSENADVNTITHLKELFNIDYINFKYDPDEFIEYGPLFSLITPWSSNCQSILQKMGLKSIKRIEKTCLVPKDKFQNYTIDPLTETIYQIPLTNFDDRKKIKDVYEVSDIETENQIKNLGFDHFDIVYYTQLFNELKRNPTNLELLDLSQSNSEHARHWFFKGKLIKDDIILPKSLFQLVKDTQKYTNDRSIVAFRDNSCVFRADKKINYFLPNLITNKYSTQEEQFHLTYTSETHNFPTSVAPFQGATTGTGGRIRDNQCVGRGGIVISGVAGYCVGEIEPSKSKYWQKNLKTLIEASNGASDYGNKFGEPLILGFTRVFGQDIFDQRHEWVKPIMFSGGMGMIHENHIHKNPPQKDMLVVKVGGPAFKIGFGGGAASSRDQNVKNINDDLNAVQRGDPEMENRLNRFIRNCIEMGEHNPIENINDQGAGGTANVTKEIVYPNGANIYLDQINKSDPALSPLETWISEYQENNTVLIKPSNLQLVHKIAERENVTISVIGQINDTGVIKVYDDGCLVLDLPLEPIVGDHMPQKEYVLEKSNYNSLPSLNLPDDHIFKMTKKVLSLPTVGSKRFLTNKVDRSVTGLIVQQQCVGPLQTPLSNYSITAQSYFDFSGTVTSIGEQPIKGIINPEKMARLALGEMITNMIFAGITNFNDIRYSANWMWPLKFPGEKNNLYLACKSMCEMSRELEIACDRGKDSLSMTYQDNQNIIKCPGSLVISGYAPTNDIRKKITPNFKESESHLYYISFTNQWRLGGSSLAYIYNQLGDQSECPDVNQPQILKEIFNKIQTLIKENKILSGHDVSDGGLITTLCEMAFSSQIGFKINLPQTLDPIHFLFSEELGLVIEVKSQYQNEIEKLFQDYIYSLGKTTSENIIIIDDVINIKINDLRWYWEKPSFEMEKQQCDHSCVEEEYGFYKKINTPIELPFTNHIPIELPSQLRKYKVAIIRDEGTNGDRELAAAFFKAGFETFDFCMNDFIQNSDINLDLFSGIAFAGGFTYSDVSGAGNGWAQIIKSNQRILQIFNEFKNRKNTFSLGVCNGCQLMSLLNWIPKCKLVQNKSHKFESRCSFVKINSTNSIMLKNMNELILPVWIAHGEGRFVLEKEPKQIPIQYVDYNGDVTETYPLNPNGSINGVSALSSNDGRHLAMMPHPERSFINWQLPFDTNPTHELYSPWMNLFINAYQWCESINS